MRLPFDPLRMAPVLALFYKLWVRTLRIEDQAAWEKIRSLKETGQRLVLCLWHEDIFCVTGYGFRKTRELVTFVSRSKDGELITRVLHSLGHATVRGSSSKGGLRSLLRAKRIMERRNRMAVFTIDGPRGPRRVPKNGPIFLAQQTGAKIVPLRAFPQNRYVFDRSWDHFQLPYPFTRCEIRVGSPYDVTEKKLTPPRLAFEKERLMRAMERLASGPVSRRGQRQGRALTTAASGADWPP